MLINDRMTIIVDISTFISMMNTPSERICPYYIAVAFPSLRSLIWYVVVVFPLYFSLLLYVLYDVNTM